MQRACRSASAVRPWAGSGGFGSWAWRRVIEGESPGLLCREQVFRASAEHTICAWTRRGPFPGRRVPRTRAFSPHGRLAGLRSRASGPPRAGRPRSRKTAPILGSLGTLRPAFGVWIHVPPPNPRGLERPVPNGPPSPGRAQRRGLNQRGDARPSRAPAGRLRRRRARPAPPRTVSTSRGCAACGRRARSAAYGRSRGGRIRAPRR